MLVCTGVGRIYPGGHWWIFLKVFAGGAKSGEICFLALKTKNTAFFVEVSKFLPPLPTPMLVCKKKFVPHH